MSVLNAPAHDEAVRSEPAGPAPDRTDAPDQADSQPVLRDAETLPIEARLEELLELPPLAMPPARGGRRPEPGEEGRQLAGKLELYHLALLDDQHNGQLRPSEHIRLQVWELLLKDSEIGPKLYDMVHELATQNPAGGDLLKTLKETDPTEVLASNQAALLPFNEHGLNIVKHARQISIRALEERDMGLAQRRAVWLERAEQELDEALSDEQLQRLQEIKAFSFSGESGELAELLQAAAGLQDEISAAADTTLHAALAKEPARAADQGAVAEEAYRHAAIEVNRRISAAVRRSILAKLRTIALDDQTTDPQTRYRDFAAYFELDAAPRRGQAPEERYGRRPASLAESHPELVPSADRLDSTDDFLAEIGRMQKVDHAVLRIRQQQLSTLSLLQGTLDELLKHYRDHGLEPVEGTESISLRARIAIPEGDQARPFTLEDLGKAVFDIDDPPRLSSMHYQMLAEWNPDLQEEVARLEGQPAWAIELDRGTEINLGNTELAARAAELSATISLAAYRLAQPISARELEIEVQSEIHVDRWNAWNHRSKLQAAELGVALPEPKNPAVPRVVLTKPMTLEAVVRLVEGIPPGKAPEEEDYLRLVEHNPKLGPRWFDVRGSGKPPFLEQLPSGTSISLAGSRGRGAHQLLYRSERPSGLELLGAKDQLEAQFAEHGLKVESAGNGEVWLVVDEWTTAGRIFNFLNPGEYSAGFASEEDAAWLTAHQLPPEWTDSVPPGVEFEISDTELGQEILDIWVRAAQQQTAAAANVRSRDGDLVLGLERLVGHEAVRLLEEMTLSDLVARDFAGMQPWQQHEQFEILLKNNPELRALADEQFAKLTAAGEPDYSNAVLPAGMVLNIGGSRHWVSRLNLSPAASLSEEQTVLLAQQQASLGHFAIHAANRRHVAELQEELAKLAALAETAAADSSDLRVFHATLDHLEQKIAVLEEREQQSAYLSDALDELRAELKGTVLKANISLGSSLLAQGKAETAEGYLYEAAEKLELMLAKRRELLELQKLEPEQLEALVLLYVQVKQQQAQAKLLLAQPQFELIKKRRARNPLDDVVEGQLSNTELPEHKTHMPLDEARKEVEPLIGKMQRYYQQAAEALKVLPDSGRALKHLAVEGQRREAAVYQRIGDTELQHTALLTAASMLLQSAQALDRTGDKTYDEESLVGVDSRWLLGIDHLNRTSHIELQDNTNGKNKYSPLGLLFGTTEVEAYADEQLTSLAASYEELSAEEQAMFLDLLEELGQAASGLANEHYGHLHYQLFSHLSFTYHQSGSLEDRVVGLRAQVVKAHSLRALSEEALPEAREVLRGVYEDAIALGNAQSTRQTLRCLADDLLEADTEQEQQQLAATIAELRARLQSSEAVAQGALNTELQMAMELSSLNKDTESAQDVSRTVKKIVSHEDKRIAELQEDVQALDARLDERLLAEMPWTEHSSPEWALNAARERFMATSEARIWAARREALESEIRFRQRSQMQVRIQEVLAHVNAAAPKLVDGEEISAQEMLDQLAADFNGTALEQTTAQLVEDFRNNHEEGGKAVLKQALQEAVGDNMIEALIWSQVGGLVGAGVSAVVATPAAIPVGYGIGVVVGSAAYMVKNLIVGRNRIMQVHETGLTTISDTEMYLNAGFVALDLIPFIGFASGGKRVGVQGFKALLNPKMLARELMAVAKESGEELTERQAMRIIRRQVLLPFGQSTLQFGGKSLMYGGLALAVGPALAQLLQNETDPSLTPHQRRDGRDRIIGQMTTIAVNIALTQGIARGIGRTAALEEVDLGRLRMLLVGVEARARARAEAEALVRAYAVDDLPTAAARGAGTADGAPAPRGQTIGGLFEPARARVLAEAQAEVLRLAADEEGAKLLVYPAVEIAPSGSKFEATFDWSSNKLLISADASPERVKALVGHELEHTRQIQFVAAAYLFGSELPPHFYNADGTVNIHPDILSSVRANPVYRGQMAAYWGLQYAELLAAAADARAQGRSGDYRAALSEQTARIAELESRQFELSDQARLAEQAAAAAPDDPKLREAADAAARRLEALQYIVDRRIARLANGLEDGAADGAAFRGRGGAAVPEPRAYAAAGGLDTPITERRIEEVDESALLNRFFYLVERVLDGTSPSLCDAAEMHRLANALEDTETLPHLEDLVPGICRQAELADLALRGREAFRSLPYADKAKLIADARARAESGDAGDLQLLHSDPEVAEHLLAVELLETKLKNFESLSGSEQTACLKKLSQEEAQALQHVLFPEDDLAPLKEPDDFFASKGQQKQLKNIAGGRSFRSAAHGLAVHHIDEYRRRLENVPEAHRQAAERAIDKLTENQLVQSPHINEGTYRKNAADALFDETGRFANEGMRFIEDLIRLQENNVRGVPKLLESLRESLKDPRKIVSGFYSEAHVAARLLDEGFEVLHVEANGFQVKHKNSPHMIAREIDVLAVKDGKLFLIETKSSSSAYTKKAVEKMVAEAVTASGSYRGNGHTFNDSQVVAQTVLAYELAMRNPRFIKMLPPEIRARMENFTDVEPRIYVGYDNTRKSTLEQTLGDTAVALDAHAGINPRKNPDPSITRHPAIYEIGKDTPLVARNEFATDGSSLGYSSLRK